MARRIAIACVVAGIVVATIFWLRAKRDAGEVMPRRSDAVASPATSGDMASAAPAGAMSAPIRTTRRLGVEERRQLAAQIGAARTRARAKASVAGSNAVPPDDKITIEQVGPAVQQGLKDAIPILADCYDSVPGARASGRRSAAVQMVMFSDPDIGTVIDTQAMADQDGKPLDPKLDECLRSAIESLGLPPLEVGGQLPLQYSFVFD